MKSYILFFLIIAMTIIASSCDDEFSSSTTAHDIDLKIGFPDDIDPVDITDAIVTFRNLSSGQVTRFSYPSKGDIRLLPGIYDVEFSASIVLENGNDAVIRGVSRSIQIVSDATLVRLTAYCNIITDDLIISEVFFTGTLQNSGNQYYGDDYIKLYNNTDHIVYADGITLFESKFLTTQKLDFSPDIMEEAVTVQAIYTIPGTGNEHPVKPGEYILLADVGIDHRNANPNSFSLEHADWEWYDVSSSPGNLDIDSPDVPNLDKWYCYTNSFWMLHNRGYKAFGIARIPVDKETYLKEYRYSYDYNLVTNAGTFPMSQTAYKIPNDWVVDVVNCSVESEWQWNVTSPRLDMGWAYCGNINNDKSRFFKAVRRKLLYIADDGRIVLKDTDNSSVDFNSNVTPSEIETQHTLIGLGQGTSQIITYDGITPISK